MKPKIFSFALNTLFIAGLGLSASAQKLPDVQPKGIAAPAGIKIDGKNTEWNDGFQASNKRTSIFYTLSNDDKNLYLVIKSTDIGNNMKILAGGITFSVNPDGKRKEKESITMTYPVRRANFRGGAGGQGGGRRAMTMVGGVGGGGAEMTSKQRDSLMAAMQRTQLAQVKEIEIRGFKTTTDTLVSIYNEFGIKAFANIESDNSFFYEAAIPLEALGLTKDTSTEFAYNIKINGLQMQGFGGGGGGGFGGGGRSFNMTTSAPSSTRSSPIDFQALMSPTDFWGKYILFKK